MVNAGGFVTVAFFVEKNLEFGAGLLGDSELIVNGKSRRFCNRCIFC
jgi:hypothetical protein